MKEPKIRVARFVSSTGIFVLLLTFGGIAHAQDTLPPGMAQGVFNAASPAQRLALTVASDTLNGDFVSARKAIIGATDPWTDPVAAYALASADMGAAQFQNEDGSYCAEGERVLQTAQSLDPSLSFAGGQAQFNSLNDQLSTCLNQYIADGGSPDATPGGIELTLFMKWNIALILLVTGLAVAWWLNSRAPTSRTNIPAASGTLQARDRIK